jgi:ribonuclease HI
MAEEYGDPNYPVVLFISQDGKDPSAPTAWSLTKGYEILSEGNSISYDSAAASAAASVLAMGNRTLIYTNSDALRTRLSFSGVDNVATSQEYDVLQSSIRDFAVKNNVRMFKRYRYVEVNKPLPEPSAPKPSTKGMNKYSKMPRLCIATDASMALNKSSVAGIAWVAEDGRHATKIVDVHDGGIMVAELWAIQDIFASMHKGQKILIQSDSAPAIHAFNDRHRIITNSHKHCSKKIEVLEAIEREMEQRDVEIMWVKGHNGHALNETADKLSRFSRHNYEKGDESLERWEEADRIILEGIGYDRRAKEFIAPLEELKAS